MNCSAQQNSIAENIAGKCLGEVAESTKALAELQTAQGLWTDAESKLALAYNASTATLQNLQKIRDQSKIGVCLAYNKLKQTSIALQICGYNGVIAPVPALPMCN